MQGHLFLQYYSYLGKSGEPLRTDIPGSSLYHLAMAIAELDAGLRRWAPPEGGISKVPDLSRTVWDILRFRLVQFSSKSVEI